MKPVSRLGRNHRAPRRNADAVGRSQVPANRRFRTGQLVAVGARARTAIKNDRQWGGSFQKNRTSSRPPASFDATLPYAAAAVLRPALDADI